MDVRTALKRQYRAALSMMHEALVVTPDDLWLSGEHPRTYWRIAYHALGYAHLYLYPDLATWQRWEKANDSCAVLEGAVAEVSPYTKDELLSFNNLILSELDHRIDAMDLDSPTCGFAWYPNVSQLELQVLSLRHFHGHLGQLHELLIARGLDVPWYGEPPKTTPDGSN